MTNLIRSDKSLAQTEKSSEAYYLYGYLYGHNVTFKFDYVLTWFNDYFALHLDLYNGVCF